MQAVMDRCTLGRPQTELQQRSAPINVYCGPHASFWYLYTPPAVRSYECTWPAYTCRRDMTGSKWGGGLSYLAAGGIVWRPGATARSMTALCPPVLCLSNSNSNHNKTRNGRRETGKSRVTLRQERSGVEARAG